VKIEDSIRYVRGKSSSHRESDEIKVTP